MTLFSKLEKQFSEIITFLYSSNIKIQKEDFLYIKLTENLFKWWAFMFYKWISQRNNSKENESLYKINNLLKVGVKLSLQNFFLFYHQFEISHHDLMKN